jgi:hypothetical protein
VVLCGNVVKMYCIFLLFASDNTAVLPAYTAVSFLLLSTFYLEVHFRPLYST